MRGEARPRRYECKGEAEVRPMRGRSEASRAR